MVDIFSQPGDGQARKERFIAQALVTMYSLDKQSALALARLGKSAAHNYGLTEQQYGLAAGPAIIAAKKGTELKNNSRRKNY